MRGIPRSPIAAAALAVAAVILGLTIAQAVRQGSLDPLWTIGWLPAVIVAALATPRTPCRGRLRPDRGSEAPRGR
jgi:hypothetical protein